MRPCSDCLLRFEFVLARFDALYPEIVERAVMLTVRFLILAVIGVVFELSHSIDDVVPKRQSVVGIAVTAWANFDESS